MEESESPVAPPKTMLDELMEKLTASPLPLKVAELAKGFKRPKKVSIPDFLQDIEKQLEEALADGRAFKQPSGPKALTRYWTRDEKHAIREAALKLAASPIAITALGKACAKESKADLEFCEGIIRELIASEKLHEHPPKKQDGPPLVSTTPPPPPPAKPVVGELIDKLRASPLPLKVADLAVGYEKPKTVAVADFHQDIERLLEEALADGRAFKQPSGPKALTRYWTRDEKHAIREAALKLAASPIAITALGKACAKESKADLEFCEGIIRELIASEKLHEHPPKKQDGPPLFATTPPPPPLHVLETAKFKKASAKLIADAKKIFESSGISLPDLLDFVQQRLQPSPLESNETAGADGVAFTVPSSLPGLAPDRSDMNPAKLETLIMEKLESVTGMRTSDLRMSLPPEYQGSDFDEAVIRLAEAERVIVCQDADPISFSEEEQAKFVRYRSAIYTNITKRS